MQRMAKVSWMRIDFVLRRLYILLISYIYELDTMVEGGWFCGEGLGLLGIKRDCGVTKRLEAESAHTRGTRASAESTVASICQWWLDRRNRCIYKQVLCKAKTRLHN